MLETPLLDLQNLSITFGSGGAASVAVAGISLSLEKGKTLALVGESGSGKSVTALSIPRLLPPGTKTSGRVLFRGEDLSIASEKRLRSLRGSAITMVFQEPMTSLNPLHSIERQIGEILSIHGTRGAQPVRTRTIELLEEVGIRDPAERLGSYPHQLSGGQRQRVMIAMALANRPDLFIADEPTTALDVTMEAQIIHLLRQLQQEFRGSILFVSHNLGLIAELCDQVTILYAGAVMESGPVRSLMQRPRHPYTRGLLDCDPARIPGAIRILPTIGGEVPNLASPPPGCVFAPRCPLAEPLCQTPPPRRSLEPGHIVHCHKAAA